MTVSELAQLKAMPVTERIKKYLPLKQNGTITKEQYNWIIALGTIESNDQLAQQDSIETFECNSANLTKAFGGYEVPAEEPKTTYQTLKSIKSNPENSRIKYWEETRDTTMSMITEMHETPERKMSQKARLLEVLKDGLPHTTTEILQRVYGVGHSGYANIHGRVTDLRKDGYNIPDAKKNDKGEWYYQIINQSNLL